MVAISNFAVADVIGPHTLQLGERIAGAGKPAVVGKFLGEGLGIANFRLGYQVDHATALLGELDQHRALVVGGAFLVEIAEIGELADVAGDDGALVVAALDEIADGHFLDADVGEQQRLNAVEVADAGAFELRSQYVEITPVQALDQARQFKVALAQASTPTNRPEKVGIFMVFGKPGRTGEPEGGLSR